MAMIPVGLVTSEERKVVLAATQSAAMSLYHLLDVFESEVGLHIPKTLVECMAARNGAYLRETYGHEAVDVVKYDLRALAVQEREREAAEQAGNA